MEKSVVIKPCPFCGDLASLVNVGEARKEGVVVAAVVVVECNSCGAAGPNVFGVKGDISYKRNAIELWNYRTSKLKPAKKAAKRPTVAAKPKDK